ncbi:drug/metabolite transporter (DMT)-like permease [Actimicrobium sp. GrIS 1.19]|uniref:DMT family transporter n=1 Tax=Actimicrobium sp. GrIS 1.19 TaxID=3071708 RepID=UPI002E011805|nr:drug/metabolite transporter (DMT)-like permease [Actimicrobium sp. GrIS 1.19]
MPSRFYGIAALLIVTLAWGTTFPAMKDLTPHFSAEWIIVIRFTMAGLLLSPFLLRAQWRDCALGAALGAILFICYMLQLKGLALTSSNRNAFVTGLNVLLVPLLGLAAGKAPERRIVFAIALAILGLFALCWDGGAWGEGDTLALIGAFFFGLYVKLLEVMTRRVSSLMVLTTVQIIAVALCAALWLLLWELPRQTPDWVAMQTALQAHKWNFLYLGLIATAAIIALQTWGQRQSSANEAAVIYAFEPACAAIAAYFWLGETMAWRGLLGAALLISGMIVSQWRPAAVNPQRVPG